MSDYYVPRMVHLHIFTRLITQPSDGAGIITIYILHTNKLSTERLIDLPDLQLIICSEFPQEVYILCPKSKTMSTESTSDIREYNRNAWENSKKEKMLHEQGLVKRVQF